MLTALLRNPNWHHGMIGAGPMPICTLQAADENRLVESLRNPWGCFEHAGSRADLLTLSQATWRKMVQNLIWATAYNAIGIPLAAGVLAGYGLIVSPASGAVIMSLSTVIVAVNARLLWI